MSPTSSSKRPRDAGEGSLGDSLDDSQDAGPPASQALPNSVSVKPTKKRRRTPTSGIIYISRIPPGMTPQKVRHLMARWGEVGKVYAQARDTSTGHDPNAQKRKNKHVAANYSEAWVEFMDKSVAKMVAKMLNAQMIGGKKGDRWRDDIWTMQYLSGFKWEMLGEQVAYERQSHQARLRAEIARSKTEQGEYLKNVELARVLEKRKVRKAEREGVSGEPASPGKMEPRPQEKDMKDMGDGKKGYKQRQVVGGETGLKADGMGSVLSSVFA